MCSRYIINILTNIISNNIFYILLNFIELLVFILYVNTNITLSYRLFISIINNNRYVTFNFFKFNVQITISIIKLSKI